MIKEKLLLAATLAALAGCNNSQQDVEAILGEETAATSIGPDSLVLSQSEFDFGSVGSAEGLVTRTFVMTNNSDSPIYLGDIKSVESSSKEETPGTFGASTVTCPTGNQPILKRQSCKYALTLTPSKTLQGSATANLVSQFGSSPDALSFKVALSAKAVIGTSSATSSTSASVSMTNQFYAVQGNNTTVSTNGTKLLKAMALNALTNAGISGVAVTFQVYPATAGTVTTSGGTTGTNVLATTASDGTVSVTFNAGTVIGPAVIVASSSAGGASFNVTVGATGTGAQILKVTGDGSSIATSSTQLLKLIALDVNNAAVVGSSVTFSISSGGTGSLTGGFQTYTTTTDADGYASVTYSSGTTSGTVGVVASVASIGSVSFSINVSTGGGGGGGGGATVSFSPTSLSPASTTWVTVPVGTTASKTMTISNSSASNIYINSVSATSAPFTIDSDTCSRAPTAMASGANCSVVLRFAPTAAGTFDRFLYVNWSSSSDGSNPQIASSALQGSGPAPISDFPGITSISTVTDSQMTLNWSTYAGNRGYAIYRVSGGVATFHDTAAIGSTSYVATSLNPSTSYTWRVNVYNTAMEIDTNTATLTQSTNAASLTPILTSISTTANVMSSISKNTAVSAGQTITVDVNNIAGGTPGNDSGMTYSCTVGRTITNACGTGAKTTCSTSNLNGRFSFDTATGVLTWTPYYAAQGTHEFCLTGTNSNGSGTAVFPVNVVNPTFGKASGDSTATFVGDWRAAFSNFKEVATSTTWEDIFGSFSGTITGAGTWGGANANTYVNPLRMTFDGTTQVDFGAALTGTTGIMWDMWVNNTNASFTTTNNTKIMMSKDSDASDNGFTVYQHTNAAGDKQFKLVFDQDYRNMILADGATVYYRMDDTSGTVLTDELGNNHGTLVAADWNFGVSGALEHAKINRSLQKSNGNGSASMLPNSNTFKPTNNFSYEFWFNLPQGISSSRHIFSYTNVAGSDGTYIYTDGNGRLTINDRYGTCTASNFATHSGVGAINHQPLGFRESQWHHIAVTYTSLGSPLTNIRTIYLDGTVALVSTCGTAASPMSWHATPAYRGFGGTGTITGAAFDEFAFYTNTVLSATQVKNHYFAGIGVVGAQASFPNNPQMIDGPVGYWRLGESSGATAVDSSGYQNHGLYNGTPTYGQTGAFLRLGIGASTNAPGSMADDNTAIIIPTTSDAVSIPGSRSLIFGQKLTVSAWLKFTTATPTGACRTIISQDDVWSLSVRTTAWTGYLFFQLGTPTACGGVQLGAYQLPEAGGTAGAAGAGWHHIAVVYDGTQAVAANRLIGYIDGDPIPGSTAVTSLTPYYTGFNNLYIGREVGLLNSAPGTQIVLDEIAVYNKALTTNNIMAQLWDASYRYCVGDVTTTFSNPTISFPYDHIATLFNGSTLNLFINGREKCRLKTGSSIDMSQDTNSLKLGATSNGFNGRVTELRGYASNSAPATVSQVRKNFNVTADMYRPQPVGPIEFTNLAVQLEPGSSRDGLRPNSTAASCIGTDQSWQSLGNAPIVGHLYNFNNCGTTYAWKGSGTPATDPYKLELAGASNMYVALGSTSPLDGLYAGSVCTWIQTSSLPVNTAIAAKASSGNAFFLGGDDTTAGRVQFYINGAANKAVSSASVADGAWKYVCGTYDGSFIRLYVNGAFQNKTAYTAAIPTTTDQFALGATSNFDRTSVANGYTGSLGGVHVYTSGLSSASIYQNCLAQAPIYTSTNPTTFCTEAAANP